MSTTLLMWLSTVFALCTAAFRSRHYATALMKSPPANRGGQKGERLRGVAQAVLLHQRLLKRPYAGVLHAFILSSFVVLSTAIIQAFGSGLFPGFSLSAVGGDTWIALLQDLFAVLLLVGIAMALYQRCWIRPARFRGSNTTDALIIYLLVVLVVASMLIEAAFEIAGGAPAVWRPVSGAIAAGLRFLPVDPEAGARTFYWIHVWAILLFLIYIPGSKHRHMFLAIPNIYLRSLEPKGKTPDIPQTREMVGVERIDQFDWKQKLDLISCTECGRCQAVCPAYASGQPLSPKTLIMDLRDAMTPEGSTGPIAGGAVAEEAIWACTTCRACMEACPVHIEHLPKIIDIRRQLVEDASLDEGLQAAFSNIARTGNSMGKPGRMRARWSRDLPFPIKDARHEPVDVLWFVGDYASYDPRAIEVTRKVATLLHAAGIDFGILHEGEQNSGNDIRRAGEEGLFETLAQANIDEIASCDFRRIMTTDPHSFNALKNEYAGFMPDVEVVHHTALLAELVRAGHLQIAGRGGRVTYHDPCYLGRYNGGYDAPRELIAAAGYTLLDMPRCRENSFCCGAGGGRIWMNDSGVRERPSENRIREALSLENVDLFVVACPKDKVMYSAATESLGVSESLPVVDVVELMELLPEDQFGQETEEPAPSAEKRRFA